MIFYSLYKINFDLININSAYYVLNPSSFGQVKAIR